MQPRQIRSTTGVSRAALGLALCLALDLVGCGQAGRVADPTPALPESDVAGSAAPAAGSLGVSNHGSQHKPDDSKDRLPDPVPTLVTNTIEADSALIDTKGGKIKAGLFEIAIPEGALDTPVMISVSDLSGMTGRIECELLPHGLHFNVPVELTVKLPDSVNPDQLTLFWIMNEGSLFEIWAPMPTRVESGGGKIIAELTHFSRYAPGSGEGKAGWGKLPARGADRISHMGVDRRP